MNHDRFQLFEAVHSGLVNTAGSITPRFLFSSLLALALIETEQSNPTKEAPRTSQGVKVPSGVSSHRTGSSFSLDPL